MVKANAYSHGDIRITHKLKSLGCKNVGVGLVEEGLHLRVGGVSGINILVFGFIGEEAVKEMLHAKLIPVVSDWGQLETLANVLKKNGTQKQTIHLKVNTGMNRLGFPTGDAEKLSDFFKTNKMFDIAGCGTHLATSEDLDDDTATAHEQLVDFSQFLKTLNIPAHSIHAFNTTGAVHISQRPELYKEFPYGLRIGLGTYGYSTVPMDQGRKLYPVMSFISRIVTVQNVKKNGRVSYGGTWTASRDTQVGIVPAGYADGIPTQLSNKGVVAIGDKQAPIIGRVCMDYTLIDVTGIQNPVGKDVEFFGPNVSAHSVAEKVGTITYDILLRISERVPRLYFGDE